MKKTKIVATLGPAVEFRGGKTQDEPGFWSHPLDVEASAQKIATLIQAGANVFRFNFSHGDHKEQGERMATVRRAEEIAGQKVAFLLDTKGPEIRTEVFEDGEKAHDYKTGDVLRVATKQGIKSTKEVIALNVAGGLDVYDDVPVGNLILVDDGKLALKVIEKDDSKREFVVEAQNDGPVGKQKGVNIPYTKIPFPALADRDDSDIRFGLSQGLNFIAISFVRTAKDVEAVRSICRETGNDHVQLIAKIENQQGLDNLDEIIEAADGIMIARGDLGVEIPAEEVPIQQKLIIKKCNAAAKPVITATQMLDSMQNNPRPTRAEVGDVANAIFDGTDAVMLSGETANGKYPFESVDMMAKICVRTEKFMRERQAEKTVNFAHTSTTEAVAQSVAQAVASLDIETVVAATSSGSTARKISKYRPFANIVAATYDEKTARSLALAWGVKAYVVDPVESTDEMFEKSKELVQELGLGKKGDAIIITAGVPVGTTGTTNVMKVETL